MRGLISTRACVRGRAPHAPVRLSARFTEGDSRQGDGRGKKVMEASLKGLVNQSCQRSLCYNPTDTHRLSPS